MYRDLNHYLVERIAAIGETPTSLAERLGWGVSYIHNIINGQFRPSSKRCTELAQAFGDDPNIILALAGMYVPNAALHDNFIALLNGLSPAGQEAAFDYLLYLTWREDRSARE